MRGFQFPGVARAVAILIQAKNQKTYIQRVIAVASECSILYNYTIFFF